MTDDDMISGRDLADLLEEHSDELRAAADEPDGREALSVIAEFCIRASDTPNEKITRVFRDVLGAMGENMVVTTGQALEAKGRREAKAEVLGRLLMMRFGELPKPVAARIAGDPPEATLDRWIERLLTVSSSDELIVDDDERSA